MNTPTINRAGQRGASLVMSLIIIVVLMLLGVSALMVSNTQQKLAGNVRFQALAQAEAESALAQAENWIAKPENTVTLGQFGVKAGLYAKGAVVSPLTMSWTDATSISCADTTFFAAATPCTNPDSQRVIVEVYAENRTLVGNSVGNCGYGIPGPCPKVNLFKATARGVSRLGATKYVQSLFAVRTGS